MSHRTPTDILDQLEADQIVTVVDVPEAEQCEHVDYGWGPHEGCREFMTEPETMGCTARATHRLVGSEWYYEEEPFTKQVCAVHALQATLADLNESEPYLSRIHVELLDDPPEPWSTETERLRDELLAWAQTSGLFLLDGDAPARAAVAHVAALMRRERVTP